MKRGCNVGAVRWSPPKVLLTAGTLLMWRRPDSCGVGSGLTYYLRMVSQQINDNNR
jgi:hypothetical protein